MKKDKNRRMYSNFRGWHGERRYRIRINGSSSMCPGGRHGRIGIGSKRRRFSELFLTWMCSVRRLRSEWIRLICNRWIYSDSRGKHGERRYGIGINRSSSMCPGIRRWLMGMSSMTSDFLLGCVLFEGWEVNEWDWFVTDGYIMILEVGMDKEGIE